MTLTQKVTWELLRSINSTTFNGTFQPIGGPLLFPSIKLKMVNNSGSLVTVSIDGVNAYDVCPAGSFWIYDELVLGIPTTEFVPQGTQIFVNGTASTGLVYLVSQYIVLS